MENNDIEIVKILLDNIKGLLYLDKDVYILISKYLIAFQIIFY